MRLDGTSRVSFGVYRIPEIKEIEFPLQSVWMKKFNKVIQFFKGF